ncbi:hypothetical protein C8J57DRAFT_1266839 [Mycena rebaudengoi]|nr:hypothetical protein C8J57DRAFT_1266839 [Mycena rebaudengoi]
MLHLPTELVLSILRFLPLATLARLQTTSREWNTFFKVNHSSIYHNAAVLHGFIPSASTVYSELDTIVSRRALAGVVDWRSFCSAQIHIKKAWRGAASSSVTAHRYAGDDVHRLKVDEERGFIITTSSQGGLNVVDLHRDEILWMLPKYVHRHAHCEYSAGYLIFDRASGEKEVWRVEDDIDTLDGQPTFASPDEGQNTILDFVNEFHPFPFTTRGHFKPWAILTPPSFTRAYRFVFPTLLAAAEDSLFLWDVRTRELTQIIQNIQTSPLAPGVPLGDINYVEVSNRHAFVCGSHSLRVFSRNSGSCVFDISSSQLSYGKNTYSFDAEGARTQESWIPSSVLKPQPISHCVVPPPISTRRLIDEFIAVHVSACGSHLVALLASCRLIVIPFFERVIGGTMDLRDIALDIQLGSSIRFAHYLAFENGRVAVATSTGLFVVEFEATMDVVEHPFVSVQRAAWFNDPNSLNSISCLQMTETGIFFNWDTGVPHESIRDYETEVLVPYPDLETRFFMSLHDEPRLLHLPGGHDVVHFLDADLVPPSHSTVFSIDFMAVKPT